MSVIVNLALSSFESFAQNEKHAHSHTHTLSPDGQLPGDDLGPWELFD